MDSNSFLDQELQRLDQQIAENQQLLSDPQMAELARAEIQNLEQAKADLINSQGNPTPDDNDNLTGNSKLETENSNIAIVEVRPAAGGEEAKIWAADLLRMYTRYAQAKNWQISELDDGVIKIKGPRAYNLLQYEAGVHRVQRVPETEAQGRIHTSTATVAVLPEIKSTESKLEPADVEFVAFRRSSGHGGQNVNKVASAVRMTHRPTGIVVESSRERGQEANRVIALQLLTAKVWQLREQERLLALSDSRSAIGRGMRSEKIRTYNYPQNRVTDHRLGKSWQELDQIIAGKLDKIFAALQSATPEDFVNS